MDKWAKQMPLDGLVFRQISPNFNRGSLTKSINTSNPLRRGLVASDVEVPLIDDRHIEEVFKTMCTDVRMYNGLLIHAIAYVIPDLNNYHLLRQKLISAIQSSECMPMFDLPNTVDDPFGSGRCELAAAFCRYIRSYFARLREKLNA